MMATPRRARSIAVAASLLILVAPAKAETGTREVVVDYNAPQGVTVQNLEAYPVKDSAFRFAARRAERRISFSVTDASGRSVRAHVYIAENRDGVYEPVTSFCGETPAPIKIASRSRIEVRLVTGDCSSEASTPTSGTITATFSR